jgi:hypothetical protein
MFCNIDQLGYNIRSKSPPAKSVPKKDKFARTKLAPQKDKLVARVVQVGKKILKESKYNEL